MLLCLPNLVLFLAVCSTYSFADPKVQSVAIEGWEIKKTKLNMNYAFYRKLKISVSPGQTQYSGLKMEESCQTWTI